MSESKTEAPKNLWLVAHPTFRYVEDVKKLARERSLVIVDKAEASDVDRERAVADAPKLTLRDEFKAQRGKGVAEGGVVA